MTEKHLTFHKTSISSEGCLFFPNGEKIGQVFYCEMCGNLLEVKKVGGSE